MTEGCLVSLDVIPTNPCVNQSAALLPAVTSLISLLGVAGVVGGALGTIVLGGGDTSPIKSTGLLKLDIPLGWSTNLVVLRGSQDRRGGDFWSLREVQRENFRCCQLLRSQIHYLKSQ